MWWALQRVKDPDEFKRKLNEAAPGETPNEADVQQEFDDFTALASAFGTVKPEPQAEESVGS